MGLDRAEGLLTVTLKGSGELIVSDDPKAPHIDLPDGERVQIQAALRAADQDQAAPYSLPYPGYNRYVSILKVPPGVKDFELFGDNIHETIGGYVYTRETEWADGEYAVMRKSYRTIAPEISAAEAQVAVKSAAVAVEADRERMELYHAGIRAQSLPANSKAWTKARLSKLSGAEAWQAGRLAYDAEDYEGALAAFKAAADKGVQDPDLTLEHSDALIQVKRYGEALARLEADQERLASRRFSALWLKATAIRAQAGEGEMVALLDRDIAAKPSVGAYALRASYRIEKGAADADQDFKAAHAIPTGDREEYEALGEALTQGGRTVEAIEAYRRAVQADPERLSSRLGLAMALESADRPAEALRVYEEALRMSPLDVAGLGGRAEMLAVLGRKDEASVQLDAMMAALPNSRRAINSVCWIRGTRNLDPAKGLAECERWLKVFPKDGMLLDTRGFAKLRLGRDAEALADYEQALKLEPEQMDSLYGRGVARMRMGAVAAGEADLAAAEKGEPGIGARWKTYDLGS